MDTRSMSILRIVRLARLARLVRIFRVFKELTIMVDGMSKTKSIIFWGSVFLLVIVYMFAMAATMVFGNAKAGECEEKRRQLQTSDPASVEASRSQSEQCSDRYEFEEFNQTELF